MRTRCFVVLALLSVGCAAARVRRHKDPLVAQLAAADALWERRAEVGGFDQALGALVNILPGAPNDPRLLYRLSRAQWVAGRIASDDALSQFEAGRAYGFRCLLANPGFAEASHRAGDRIDAAAVAALTDADVPCVAWAVANAVATVETRGPGSALRLEDLAGAVEAARGRSGVTTNGMLEWDAAKLILLNPSATGREDARASLQAAIKAAPTNGVFRHALATDFPDAADAAWEGWVEGEYVLEERGSTPRTEAAP